MPRPGNWRRLAPSSASSSSLAATPWMDRWSRRTWLRLEGSLVLVAIIVSALAPSFGWLMVGRVLASCGSAVIMANCMTGARELFHDPVWRNRAIGIIVSATTFAFVLGMPLVTLIEARLGWRIAMGSIAVPVVLLLAGTFVLPPSPQRPQTYRASSSARGVPGRSRRRADAVSPRRSWTEPRVVRGVARLLRRLHDRRLRRVGDRAQPALFPQRSHGAGCQQSHAAADAPLRRGVPSST